jgi:hypothetical protein
MKRQDQAGSADATTHTASFNQIDLFSNLDHQPTLLTVESNAPLEPKAHSQRVMSADQPRTVLVDFADEQFVHDVDDLASTTLIHVSLYAKFLRERNPANNWTDARVLEHVRKHHQTKAEWRGKRYKVFSFFHLPVLIEGCQFYVRASITVDDDLTGRIILGRNIFEIFSMNETATDMAVPTIQLDQGCGADVTFDVNGVSRNTRVLLDTGAGPSIMSREFWEEVKGDADLRKDLTPLKAANNEDMGVVGRTPPLQFKLGNTEVVLSFLVTERLGGREALLGRDFLYTYDVAVDLPRNRLLIRNPNGEYIRKKVIRVLGGKEVTYAKCVTASAIPPSTMVYKQVAIPHKARKAFNNRQVIAVPATPRDSIVQPGRTVAVPKDGKIFVPMLNLDQGTPRTVVKQPKIVLPLQPYQWYG